MALFGFGIIDKTTGGSVSLSHSHHEVHEGCHFFTKSTIGVDGAGTVARFLFTTPAGPTRVHANAAFDAEAEFVIKIFEGTTTSDDGTPVATFNNDRDSANTPGLVAYLSPTVTDDGTEIWRHTVGSGKSSTGVAPALGYEMIAKTSTKYMFEITKLVANEHYLNYDFWWYEE